MKDSEKLDLLLEEVKKLSIEVKYIKLLLKDDICNRDGNAEEWPHLIENSRIYKQARTEEEKESVIKESLLDSAHMKEKIDVLWKELDAI